MIRGIDGGPGLVQQMVVPTLGDRCNRVTPGFAAVGGCVEGDSRVWIEAAVVIVKNLRVVEGIGIGAVHDRIATEEVVGRWPWIDRTNISERGSTVGGIG